MTAPPGLLEISAAKLSAAPPRIRELSRNYPGELFANQVVWYSTGSTELDALTLPPNTGVIVDGDLRVQGVLDDRPLRAVHDNMRFIVTAGNVVATTILLGSEMFVGGSLTAAEWLIAESDGDYRLTVCGDLTARRIIALGQHVRVQGKTSAEFAIGYLGLTCDIPKSEMGKHFVSDLVNEWGGVDIETAAARVLDGKPILLRNAPESPNRG